MSTRFRASIAGCEVGMIGAGCRSGLRRRMRIIPVGCRMLIAVGGSRDLMRVDAGCLTVSDCEDLEVDTVVAAAADAADAAVPAAVPAVVAAVDAVVPAVVPAAVLRPSFAAWLDAPGL